MYDSRAKKELEQAIAEIPRVHLARLPTPLEEARRLSQKLGGGKIYLKRDDLTGLALGGNKARYMEFILANAVKAEADVVVSGGSLFPNNFCRQLTAACRKLGLEAHYILYKREGVSRLPLQGNRLLDLIMGAKLFIADTREKAVQQRLIQDYADRLRKQGHKPYITGTSDVHLSCISYLNFMIELIEQLEEVAVKPDYLFLASSGPTGAGIALGVKHLQMDLKVFCVNPGYYYFPDLERKASLQMAHIANRTAEYLGLATRLNPADIQVIEDYVGENSYEIPLASIEAIRTVASTEGVILDPMYTGRAMAALIEWARSGKDRKGQSIIFLHTGGIPALFTYNELFRDALDSIEELQP